MSNDEKIKVLKVLVDRLLEAAVDNDDPYAEVSLKAIYAIIEAPNK